MSQKLTDRDALTTPASDDVVHIVDVSDDSQDDNGSSYKITVRNLSKAVDIDNVEDGTTKKVFTATERTKLDSIEASATADQTGAEIKTLYEGEADTNAFTDAEKSKLSGIEDGADVTDTANVTSAGALMDSEVTNLAQVKAFDSSDYAPALGPDDNYVTDAEKTVIGNTSGVNTGDQSSGDFDHGGLQGLSDDDHTQYTRADGTRAFSGKVSYASHPTFTADTEVVDKKYVDDEIAATPDELSDLSDVGLTTPTNRNVLVADGDSWESRALVEADISDLGSYLTSVAAADITDATADGIALMTSADANPFTDADESKLDGIETLADVTDATNVASAGAIMDGDFSSNGLMKRTGAGAYATAVEDTDYQGVPSEGAFIDGDKTKLDGIETGATADQSDAEIKTAYENNADTNAFTDSEKTKLGNAEVTTNKNSANGYAGLDASSKLNPAQLPALAVSETYVVASEVDQLALTVQEGDIAVRTDEEKSYIALNDTNGSMSDWQELLSPTADVSSVFGRTGAVTAQSGDYSALQITNAFDTTADDLDDISAGTTNKHFTATDESKLDGIETGADVTDTANVTSAGALMDSELTDLAGIKSLDTSTIQTKPSEGAFVDGDKTKLDGIETGADVTDETNVTDALDGATLSDVGTPASGDKVLLQDASDSDNLKYASFSEFGGGSVDKITEGNTEAEVVDTGSDGHFKVTTEGTERLRVNASGDVGIGTDSPTQQLELTESIELPNTTDATTGVIFKGGNRFIHNFEASGTSGQNFFAGVDAGNFTLTGSTSGVDGSYNTGVGRRALLRLTTGESNSALGEKALYFNTTGVYNSAVGRSALHSNSAGDSNSALGMNALYSNTTGDSNSALGVTTFFFNTTGSRNVAIGRNAGAYQSDGLTGLETPENSIYIGYTAKSGSDPSGGEDAITNELVIGYDAVGLGANTTVLGNSDTTLTKIFGALKGQELSADPSDPSEGEHVIWQSDGTGSGSDGDIMIKITAGGTTKTATLIDFSIL